MSSVSSEVVVVMDTEVGPRGVWCCDERISWSQQSPCMATIRRLFVWQVAFVVGLRAFVSTCTTEVSCGEFGVANPQFGTEPPLRSGFDFPINSLASCSSRQIRKAHPVALTMYGQP